jgi:hypothetical protein
MPFRAHNGRCQLVALLCTCVLWVQAEMEHRISLTRIKFLTSVSNQMDNLKNLSFVLAVVINLLILLSVSASKATDRLEDKQISTLLDNINIGTNGPLGSRRTWAIIRCVSRWHACPGPAAVVTLVLHLGKGWGKLLVCGTHTCDGCVDVVCHAGLWASFKRSPRVSSASCSSSTSASSPF